MQINEMRYPYLYEILQYIDVDNGRRFVDGAVVTWYMPSDVWIPKLDSFEKALSKLTKEERETFAIGEESEMSVIREKDFILFDLNDMINEYFDHETIVWEVGYGPIS